MNETNSVLIPPQEVAAKLNVTVPTLAIWRCVKRYKLPYVRIGRKIMYKVADVEAFIESRTCSGTAAPRTESVRRKRARM